MTDIATNLSPSKFQEVLAVIESNQKLLEWIPDSISIYAGSCTANFIYKGENYCIEETYEKLAVLNSLGRKIDVRA